MVVIAQPANPPRIPPALLSSRKTAMTSAFASLVETDDPTVYDILTRAPGPEGRLPLTEQMLRESPSGDIFGLTQDVGMGWRPDALSGQEYLILSTQGGIRAADGTPIALGYHTGHWEVG